MKAARISAVCAALCLISAAFALDPRKSLTQYSRTTWAQEQGLPQDTIRAIAQTADGYLWLGTDEGLARFDGYDFVIFNKANGDLPNNSITTLAAGPDGSLWIGTSGGLTQYRANHFVTFTMRDGLPDDAIGDIFVDHAGTLWLTAGIYLSHFEHGKFTNFAPGQDLPVTSVRMVREDARHNLWVAGLTSAGRLVDGKFKLVLPPSELERDFIICMMPDRQGNVWVGASQRLIELTAAGRVRRFGTQDGLPDGLIRSLLEDRDGAIWAGTNSGIARLAGDRFVAPEGSGAREQDVVRSLFEDREGDLWVGSANGLTRLRDDLFTVYGKTEGLPSDEPTAVHQDRAGRIWVGFRDSGLMLLNQRRPFTARDGLPATEVFSIRETRAGEPILATRLGVARMRDGRFSIYSHIDPTLRRPVFDAMEDSSGRVWMASGDGLMELRGGRERNVLPGGPLLTSAVVTLLEARDGALWAGTFGKGLWRVKGDEKRLFTMADGLSSDQIRALHQDSEGTLWIGTFGGGLDALRGGQFLRFTAKEGLLSDNISNIEDDGASLWLSTTRGICRIAKQQLTDLAAGRRASLDPRNYGIDDGLRSAQCSPAFPVAAGGERTSDGRLWFTTSRGLAVFEPAAQGRRVTAPVVHVVSVTADDHQVDLSASARLAPGNERIQIRYNGINLSAPERVQYSYKLEGLDRDWVRASSRRVTNYNSLRHGHYRFVVRASLPGGPSGEASYSFDLLPEFYETAWFRVLFAAALAAAGWGIYQLRLRQIRSRFSLVLDERARLAREIHDTLAQGFVGISSQLDAVAMSMEKEDSPARKYLDMARRMARHSLTEARRSVMDLRASVLEGQDLGAALESGARMWTAGSGVEVEVAVEGEPGPLPQETEQHLLRIAQEGVVNAVKHAAASKIWIKLSVADGEIRLRIIDNGRGFDQPDVFSEAYGHFGVIGMRERAERLHGEMRLTSRPGEGTEVEVKAPLP